MVKQIVSRNDEDFSPLRIFIPAIVFLLLLRLVAFEIVRVDGSSMAPAVEEGSTLLITRLAYGLRSPFGDGYLLRWSAPESGDIVLLPSPLDGAIVVKRVFATPGDTVDFSYGILRMLNTQIVLDIAAADEFAAISSVPEGRYFVLGDNAERSLDSRHYGFVRIDDIRGRVVRF